MEKCSSAGLLLGFIFAALPIVAQTPAGGEFRVNTHLTRVQVDPVVAFAPDGRYAIAWTGFLPEEPGDHASRIPIIVRGYAATGQPVTDEIPLSGWDASGSYSPSLCFDEVGRLVMVWFAQAPEPPPNNLPHIYGQLFDADFKLAGDIMEVDADIPESLEYTPGIGGVYPAPGGGCSAVWMSTNYQLPAQPRTFWSQQFLNGERSGPNQRLFQFEPPQPYAGGHLTVAPATPGDSAVIWSYPGADGDGFGLSAKLFTAAAQPIGETFPVNFHTRADQVWPDSCGVGNGFVAVWQSTDQDGSLDGIYGSRFSGVGQRLGAELRVNTATLSAQRAPSVAADAAGNFVVVWQSFDPDPGSRALWDIHGQLYRKDGTRVGGEFRINGQRLNEQTNPDVAFGPNGTFAVAWQSFEQDDGDEWDIYARRFSASPGDEACVWSGSRIDCDTGRTGGKAEFSLSDLDLLPADRPLLGDMDGDGRADLCLRRGRWFLCDTDHQGLPFELRVKFGRADASVIPLLGDVDGDGRAEACVRDGRFFLCDTDHRGGPAEWAVRLGEPGDPLLGDVDGDGSDDPCLFRQGRFLCDTAHDGRVADLIVAFGQVGDLPFLGDFDGDRTADFCVLRAGVFLCDTAHDGGDPEGRLVFGNAGDRPLLANVDGL